MHAAILAKVNRDVVDLVFTPEGRDRIARSVQLLPVVVTRENFAQYREEAAQVEVVFGTWGLPHELLTPENFPALRVVFFGAGTIKAFGRPLLERGVQIVTAKTVNAVCVAEFCLAQIILACKGYFRNAELHRRPIPPALGAAFAGSGTHRKTIALIGMGAVARELVEVLRPFEMKVIAVDPYLTPPDAEKIGVTVVNLEPAFAEAHVVSNHLPDLPEIKGVLNRKLFASMRPDATFINTGRGAQVNEADLIEVFQSRPDLTALLDVTEPEPPVPGSPLYRMPNVHLTSHIAGALNDDLALFGEMLAEELERYVSGQPFRHAESLAMLNRVA